MNSTRSRLLLALSFSLVLLAVARADNWPGWRGPGHDGVAGGEGYAVEWDTKKNVLWKVKLPGGTGSTPVIWDDRIFLSSPGGGKNLAICLDLQGNELWKKDVGGEKPGKHRKGSGSNPSPVTDGERVYFYYKSGDLACFDLSGKPVWRKNLQEEYEKDTLWWDLGTSPILTENHVVIAVMQTGPSYVVALDKETGKEAWKHDRNLGAPVEAQQSYSTPVLVQGEGGAKIVILGGDHVTAHEAKSGAELWRVGGLNPEQDKYFRSISGPVVCDGVVIAPYARGNSLTAIRLGGKGDVRKSHVAWEKGFAADVPTPVAADGKVYVLDEKDGVACFDLQTGREVWKVSLGKARAGYSASPILAEGKIYVTREDGKSFVLGPKQKGDGYKIIGENELDERTLATPVLVGGRIYLRTYEHLYCIGSK